jgi:molybdenum cofactor cytidylyltransferase
MPVNRENGIVGVLLAAGRGTRFGGDKLLARLASGDVAAEPVGVVALRHLRLAVPDVIAVVRDDDRALAAELGANGARIVRCVNADEGMGASLACGVRATADAKGWLVALADMPWISAATIERVSAAVAAGAPVAAPFHRGKRGHPVGFSSACYAALAALTGDAGAKAVVGTHRDRIVRIDVDDAGILQDVDAPSDLSRQGSPNC